MLGTSSLSEASCGVLTVAGAFQAGLLPTPCLLLLRLTRLCSLSWALCSWHAALLAGPGSAAGQVTHLQQEAGGVRDPVQVPGGDDAEAGAGVPGAAGGGRGAAAAAAGGQGHPDEGHHQQVRAPRPRAGASPGPACPERAALATALQEAPGQGRGPSAAGCAECGHRRGESECPRKRGQRGTGLGGTGQPGAWGSPHVTVCMDNKRQSWARRK